MRDVDMNSSPFRVERDSLGAVNVPSDRLWGAQTQRALANFPMSGATLATLPGLIVSLAQVKRACARANALAGELDPAIAGAIERACLEVEEGRHGSEFPVDVCQGGAGTSTNMNMNEVLANRALDLLGFGRGRHDVVHPNDHVNRNQSTNDAYATAARLTVVRLNAKLRAALQRLAAAFEARADAFHGIAKLGRTQLQDAVPMTLGQEFAAFATAVTEDVDKSGAVAAGFLEVNLGGTAIGTGIGSSEAYRSAVLPALRDTTGLAVVATANRIEASWDMGAFVLYSGMLKRIAAKLSKIASDLRLLASGPAGGLGEIRLPARQPGSSLMPGKINPVIPEAVNAAAFRVFGLDTAISFAAEAGQLQLNAFEPLIIWSIHEAVDLLTAAATILADLCVDGIEADADRCARNLDGSAALATMLVPEIGYTRAAAIAGQIGAAGGLAAAIASLEPEISPRLLALTGLRVRNSNAPASTVSDEQVRADARTEFPEAG